MASDSRTNAGHDQINTTRKMHTFEVPGKRVFSLLTSGSLSCSQSVMTLLHREFDLGEGLAVAPTMYDAARVIGKALRAVDELDREALERDDLSFNVTLLFGGQIKGQPPALYLVYPQGNPLAATQDAPYLQIGEIKYGRPVLDRGVRYGVTTLEDAAKLAMLSLDSTMKSNVTVGPPIDLLVYRTDELAFSNRRRFALDDPDLAKIRTRWDAAIRQAILKLPNIRLAGPNAPRGDTDKSIQLIEQPGSADAQAADVQQGSAGRPDKEKR